MKILFSFLLASFFCFQFGNAQQLTKKHQVKKGETVYQISRIYNVSPQDIIKLNPSSARALYVGDEIIIPSDGNTNSEATSNNGNNQSINHHVLKGETKYSLSKKYGLTIAELEQQNPHIKNGLQAGHYLTISSSNLPTVPPRTYVGVKNHNVQKGETLYSLSKQYGISIQDIKSANPEMTILKQGTRIAIPTNNVVADNNELERPQKNSSGERKETITETEKTNTVVADNNAVEELEKNPSEETIEAITETEKPKVETALIETPNESTNDVVPYKDYTIRPNETLYSLSKQANMSIEEFVILNPQLKETVLTGTIITMPVSTENQLETSAAKLDSQSLPLVAYDNLLETIDKSARKKILFVMPFTEEEFNNSQQSESSIKTDFKQNLNFYKGAKIALDSIEYFGVSIDSEIVEIDIESTVTPSNVRSKNNSLEGYDAVIAPSYSDNIDWLVSLANDRNIPVVTAYSATNNSHLTNVVEAYPSTNIQKLTILDHLKTQQGNLILISDYNREDVRNFIITHAPQTKVIETKRNGNYSSRDLTSILDKSKTNYIIIDSDKNGVFLNTTNTLLQELSQYKIQLVVLEKSLIPNAEDISSKRFTILKLLYPEVNHMMASSLAIPFSKNYTSKYGTEPSPTAQEGFDITYDTLLRMCQNNNTFVNSLNKTKTAHSTLEFNYKTTESGRHINDIILIKEFKSSDSNN